MTALSSYLPLRLKQLFETWSQHIVTLSGNKEKIEYFLKEHPHLLKDTDFFIDILTKIKKGSPYPDIHRCGLFENEMILFINSSRLFSIRFAMYEPGEYTIVHDHSSWGVFGTVFGSLEVIKYKNQVEDAENNRMKLSETSRCKLEPPDTDFTLPLNDGIHKIGNPTDTLVLTASIYGNPTRRLFINAFDIKTDLVYPVYPPRIKKRKQAEQALQFLRSH